MCRDCAEKWPEKRADSPGTGIDVRAQEMASGARSLVQKPATALMLNFSIVCGTFWVMRPWWDHIIRARMEFIGHQLPHVRQALHSCEHHLGALIIICASGYCGARCSFASRQNRATGLAEHPPSNQ